MNDASDASFSVTFPLPFRVLSLIGLGILGWAANVHGLRVLGVDAVRALDLKPEAEEYPHVAVDGARVHRPYADPRSVYVPVYRLALIYAGFSALAWWFYDRSTQGNATLANVYKFIPSICALFTLIMLVNPYDTMFKRTRDAFLLSLRRCLNPPHNTPVYFSDVVFADIFTSYAKVIGDVWLSLLMLLPGGSLVSPPRQGGLARWILPTLMSLPYAIRLRQCLIEYFLPGNTSKKQLWNAIKYASSFPVIYLSAAQRLVVSDLVRDKGERVVDEPWHGEHALFRLWLLAGAVNSLYSFWWDVTNDWGFDLLVPASGSKPLPPRALVLPTLHQRDESVTSRSSSASSPHSHTPTSRSSHPWGLRSVLLYPLPLYAAAIFADFVLRLTWAVKLSSHLHAHRAGEGSGLIFVLEVAEIFRRWMWVFFRVEWEVVRTPEGQRVHRDEIEALEMAADELDSEGNGHEYRYAEERKSRG
ncbi:EXS-domain-containing protein [Peniophora sp. CONT]|nr:EXS-domain-containing protein [Peniophora sp. CONT]